MPRARRALGGVRWSGMVVLGSAVLGVITAQAEPRYYLPLTVLVYLLVCFGPATRETLLGGSRSLRVALGRLVRGLPPSLPDALFGDRGSRSSFRRPSDAAIYTENAVSTPTSNALPPPAIDEPRPDGGAIALSIVVPVYNEEENVDELYAELTDRCRRPRQVVRDRGRRRRLHRRDVREAQAARRRRSSTQGDPLRAQFRPDGRDGRRLRLRRGRCGGAARRRPPERSGRHRTPARRSSTRATTSSAAGARTGRTTSCGGSRHGSPTA